MLSQNYSHPEYWQSHNTNFDSYYTDQPTTYVKNNVTVTDYTYHHRPHVYTPPKSRRNCSRRYKQQFFRPVSRTGFHTRMARNSQYRYSPTSQRNKKDPSRRRSYSVDSNLVDERRKRNRSSPSYKSYHCSQSRSATSRCRPRRRQRRSTSSSCSSSSSSGSSSSDSRSSSIGRRPTDDRLMGGPDHSRDDKENHLIMSGGEVINGRYEVAGILGEGTFGRVAFCQDLNCNSRDVAVKVIKSVKKYREAAKLEIKVLETLSRQDPQGNSLCIQALDWFDFYGHTCIVFEKLGQSVFEFMKSNEYAPYPFEQVRNMAYQLCSAIKFMFDCRLTHTDLKPENILFVDSAYDLQYDPVRGKVVKVVRRSDIRLIDFGSATFEHEHHTTIVSTRHYRPPEVILELTWSYPCDVWGIACILFELYSGVTLFMTHDNLEHLAMMERVLGHLPSWMIRETKKSKYFHNDRLDWNWDSTDGCYVRDTVKPLYKYITLPQNKDHRQLFDLLMSMFNYDADRRISAASAMRHELFYCYHYFSSGFANERGSRSRDRYYGSRSSSSRSRSRSTHYSRSSYNKYRR